MMRSSASGACRVKPALAGSSFDCGTSGVCDPRDGGEDRVLELRAVRDAQVRSETYGPRRRAPDQAGHRELRDERRTPSSGVDLLLSDDEPTSSRRRGMHAGDIKGTDPAQIDYLGRDAL